MRLAPSPPSAAQAPRGAGRWRPDRGKSRPGPINSWHVGPAAMLVGLFALTASLLYFVSDVVEAWQGGFSDRQLWLTFIAEAAVPIFVVGLAVVQRPRLGRLGELAALAYAYAYVVFTGTVFYALVNNTKDYDALTHDLGAGMTIHGAVMVVAGLGSGYAVSRARLLPAWTAVALMVGVVLVALAQGLPEGAQLVAAGVRDLGFAGMGVALVRAAAVDRAPTASRSAAGAEAMPGVYLYWLPLGAGAHVVRISGRAFESVSAHLQRRPQRDLYHSALEVVTTDGRFVIEMTPIPDLRGRERGVVAGTVGTKWARPFRVFRYEIRRCVTGQYPTSCPPSRARFVSRTTLLSRNGSSITFRSYLPRSGDATNCTPARCGTPTRLPLGSWRPPESTPTRSILRQTVALQVGTPDWWSPARSHARERPQ